GASTTTACAPTGARSTPTCGTSATTPGGSCAASSRGARREPAGPGPVPALLPPGEGQPERSPAGARPRAGPLLGIHPRHARMGTGTDPGRPGPRGAPPMTAVRDHDQGGRRYRVVCAGCGTAHTPPLVPRTASDARLLARRDGWRAPTAKKKRRTQTDQCPTCKQKENALMAT